MNAEQPPSDARQIGRRIRLIENIYRFPYWFLGLTLIAVIVILLIAQNDTYSNIFNQLVEGIIVTLRVSIQAYFAAFFIGLIIGLIRAFPPRAPVGRKTGFMAHLRAGIRVIVYNLGTMYVEIMRGLPILITLLITAFVLFPLIRDNILEPLLGIEIDVRGGSEFPAIFALSLTYGAFMSETFRAGIQSIERGQWEAGQSLGMTGWQTIRFIILPQAIRRVLPPLGNDFIAMIKDSSLVSVLGIRDVTQIARVSSGRSFRYLETYLIVAVIYLTMTILGSMVVKGMERYLRRSARR
jgi:polar amino acid transport system permease protein